MVSTLYKTFMRTSLWLAMLKSSVLCKVSFIAGSFNAFFSASALVAPLVGAFNNSRRCITIFSIGLLLRIGLLGLPSAHYLAYHIPGLCAALYWSSRSVFIGLVLPLLCIIAFVIHPIGLAAFPYTFFWIIPIVLHCYNKESLFSVALSSTFVAHAVGSVIWLYTIPTLPTLWYGLLPIVLIERLAFASGMALIVKVVHSLRGRSFSRIAYPTLAKN